MRIVIWTSGDADALKLVQRIQQAMDQGQIPGTEIAAMFCNCATRACGRCSRRAVR